MSGVWSVHVRLKEVKTVLATEVIEISMSNVGYAVGAAHESMNSLGLAFPALLALCSASWPAAGFPQQRSGCCGGPPPSAESW